MTPTITPIKPRRIAGFGWRKDSLDARDRTATIAKAAAPLKVSALPKSVDLRSHVAMPPIYDQGDLGSCTANAIGAAFEYELRKQKLADFMPSRLAIYYGERFIEGTVSSDAGAEIRDGMKVIAKQGAGPESLWPYNVALFRNAPSAEYQAAAAKHLCISYERVAQTEVAIKRAIAAGYLVVFGMLVFEEFESAAVESTGRVPMPKSGASPIGAHATALAGYGVRTTIDRNSWSTAWGRKGYCTLPLDYVLDPDLSSDFWIVKVVE